MVAESVNIQLQHAAGRAQIELVPFPSIEVCTLSAEAVAEAPAVQVPQQDATSSHNQVVAAVGVASWGATGAAEPQWGRTRTPSRHEEM